MEKYGIVIDSTVYLSKEVVQQMDARVVSLNVVSGTTSYKETEVNNDFIFDLQDKGHQLTTSQPAPGEFLKTYEEMLEKGYEKIFVVTLSANISGTYQSANLAKNMLEDPSKVHIFDTMLCAFGNEMITVELNEMIKNKNSIKEIEDRITKLIESSNQMFTVENLFSLTKGGRLSKTRAAIGTVLRVKPIIRVVDGKLSLVNSERTYKKVHQYFLDNIKETTKGYNKISFYVTNTNSLESAKVLEELLKSEFPNSKIIFTSVLGPVFSIHIGKKGCGLSWFAE